MRLPPAVWAGGAGLAQWLLARHTRPTGASTVAATVVGLASVGMAGSAAASFLSRRTSIDPMDVGTPRVLVTDGANALTRNPMYVGLAGLLTAHAVYRRSPAALLPVLGFVAVIDRWQIRAEETALSRTFGADYEAYRRAVPRWLGPTRPAPSVQR